MNYTTLKLRITKKALLILLSALTAQTQAMQIGAVRVRAVHGLASRVTKRALHATTPKNNRLKNNIIVDNYGNQSILTPEERTARSSAKKAILKKEARKAKEAKHNEFLAARKAAREKKIKCNGYVSAFCLSSITLATLALGSAINDAAINAKNAKEIEAAKIQAEIEAAKIIQEQIAAVLEKQAEHAAKIEAAKKDAGWYGLKGSKNRFTAWATGNPDMALQENQSAETARLWNKVPGSAYANKGARWAWNKIPAIRRN